MKVPFGGLWAEFKAFAFKGNMIELAVAVVIGAAFGNVIHSLVNDVIMPTTIYVVQTASHAAKEAENVAKTAASKVLPTSMPTSMPTSQPTTAADDKTPPPPVVQPPATPAQPSATPAAADPTKVVNFVWDIGPVHAGAFIGELINFILIAAAVFLMVVKLMGGVMKRMSKPEVPGEPTTRECPECLSLIPIKARRCSHCTAVIAPATP